MTPTAAYCEMRPTFQVGGLFTHGRKDRGMGSWFPDSGIHFTYRGRTALRYVCKPWASAMRKC